MNGEYSQPVFKHKWIKNLYYSFVSKEELTDEIKEYLLALDNGSKSLKREEFEEITSMESAMVRHPKNIKSGFMPPWQTFS